MIEIGRIGHLTLETPDVPRKLDHLTRVIGLSVTERSEGATWLACPEGGPALLLRHGAVPRPARLSLRLSPSADPAEVLRDLRGHGLAAERRTDSGPDMPEAVTFTDPNGLEVDLHPDQPATPPPPPTAGVVPRKLGHVAFFVPDPQATTRFYCEVLGFRVSDWIGDFFAFLRCNPDHHSLNFFRRPDAGLGLHHMAFELRDWNQVKEACDMLGHHRVPLTWGPGRHGAGHNIYTYHDDPDGHSVELFTELDRMSDEASGCFDPQPWHLDTPQRPKVWPPGIDATNAWGIPKPPRPA